MTTWHKLLRLFLATVILVTAILYGWTDSVPVIHADEPPVPLPAECGGATPPGTCCIYGYIYYDDIPVAGVNVHIESPYGALDTTTAVYGEISSHPFYSETLSYAPLSVAPGDVITITASYSDMVSARTWTVQSDGQQVDLGLVAGYQAPSPTPTMATDIHDSTPTVVSDRAQVSALSQGIPLTFIENVGQFDKRARFRVNSGNTTLFLTDDALWVSLTESSLKPDPTSETEIPNNADTEIETGRGVNLKLSFVGSNPHPRLEPFDRLDTRVSFFTGGDPAKWHADVPAWRGVRYLDLYPGIDLEITSQNGQLVQHLVVRVDGTASQLTTRNSQLADIRLQVEGADDLTLEGNYLRLTTPLGDFAFPLPTVEGATPKIAPAISVINETYQVSAPFASMSPLVVNAMVASTSTLLYSTYLGGSGYDIADDIAVDSTDNVYITGETSSTDFPTTPGAYDTSYSGDPIDVFIAKLSADGSMLLYSTYLGGNGEDAGNGITVDSLGNVYVTGKTYSTDFPTTDGALDRNLGGGRDAFVAKLNADGSELVYSTYVGGSSWEYSFDIAVDDAGNAYVTGFTHGGFPTTPGVVQPTHGGAIDPFVAKLNPDGSALVYSTYLGGSSNDGGDSIVVDGDGNVYLTGGTGSTDFPTANPMQPTKAGGISDAFVAKLNVDGSALVYSTYLGGSTSGDGETGRAIVIDSAGNAYVTGSTNATDFPTVSPLQPTYGGGALDVFVAKLSTDGSALIYSTYLGGSGTDERTDIVIDSIGNAYITGVTTSADFPTANPLQATNGGGSDAFVAKLNTDSSALLFSSYLGGSGDENPLSPSTIGGIAVDSGGNVFLVGTTGSTDFPTTPGAYDTSHNGGGYDVFVTKLSLGEPPPSLLYSTYLGGSCEEEGYDIAVDSEGDAYVTGSTASVDFPTTPGAYSTSNNDDVPSCQISDYTGDVFVTKLSADGGTLLYSTYLGGGSFDGGVGIVVDDAGNAFIAGATYSDDFPTTPGVLDADLDGGRDVFVAKLSAAGDALIYSTYLGGSSWEYGFDIAVDDAGNAYVGGFTHGSFPTTPGAFQTTFGGTWDGYIAKLNIDGSALLYSTYLGGSGGDSVFGIDVDETGSAYVTGEASSTDFPTTPGAWDTTCDNCQTNVSQDGFVAKLNAAGSALIYSTLIGGSSTPAYPEVFLSISVDGAGNAYVAGRTAGDDFPTTVNALQPDFGGGSRDAVVAKLNADGSALLYSTYLGGSGTDDVRGIDIDSTGNAYVTGRTTSTDFPIVSPLQASNGGAYDAFVAKLNADGSGLLYSTYLGGNGDENMVGSEPHHLTGSIALDDMGNVYLIGVTGSPNFPTANPLQPTFGGGDYDAFVTKISMDVCGWSLTGSLADGRHEHTATLLSDGRVLVVGGIQKRIVGTPGLTSTEIYSPTSGTWSTTGSLNIGRRGHTATLLPDGRVLVVGGRDSYSGSFLASVEIYDPASGTWSSAAPLSVPRGSHTATRLPDGRVFVVGGRYSTSSPDVHASAEIYDPVSETWSSTGSLNTPRESHSATLLSDGRVLVVNGYYQSWLASAEIYDPASGTWSEAPLPLYCHGVAHTATLLPDGRVLVVGGACGSGTPGISDGAEIYDPVDSTWTATTDLPEAREVHTAVLLPDGTVLVVGGDDGDVPRYDSALIYNPASGTWNRTDSLAIGRRNHTATLLDDGRVLVVAGWGDTTTYLDSAEIYYPCQISSPVAAFAAAPLSGTAPLTVTFTDQSVGAITTWDWTFGDGGISGARHPAHEYTDPGTYTVSLTVSGPSGSDTESKTDYIVVSPITAPTWTFLLYLDGDNNLHHWFKRALGRLEAASANLHVAILVQFDGPRNGDTWRYKIQPGVNYSWYMGELDMSDPQTLSDFIIWARDHYPADHTYLAVADHGHGTTGIAWDDTSGSDSFITVAELRIALQSATDGIEPLDVVHYDACLMAMIEDAYQIKDYANYLVASENLGWSVFAYDTYVAQVTTDTTPEILATAVVSEYHHALVGYPHTISALDLGQAITVTNAISTLATSLQSVLSTSIDDVQGARTGAQKFDSRDYYVINDDDEYLDLYDLARLLEQYVDDADVDLAAQQVMDTVTVFVSAERHESGNYRHYPYWDLDDAYGVSIYFPREPGGWGYDDYINHVSFRFTVDTKWDEFLQDYYGVIGTPPEEPINPGRPPMLSHAIYLPIVLRQ